MIFQGGSPPTLGISEGHEIGLRPARKAAPGRRSRGGQFCWALCMEGVPPPKRKFQLLHVCNKIVKWKGQHTKHKRIKEVDFYVDDGG